MEDLERELLLACLLCSNRKCATTARPQCRSAGHTRWLQVQPVPLQETGSAWMAVPSRPTAIGPARQAAAETGNAMVPHRCPSGASTFTLCEQTSAIPPAGSYEAYPRPLVRSCRALFAFAAIQ